MLLLFQLQAKADAIAPSILDGSNEPITTAETPATKMIEAGGHGGMPCKSLITLPQAEPMAKT